MVQHGGFEVSEDLKKRADELREKTAEKEIGRIETLVSISAEEFAESRNKDTKARYEENIRSAERIRNQTETNLLDGERLVKLKLQAEIEKRAEAKKRQQEELKRQEEERKRKEEEENRLRAEEENRRLEEEKKRQLEEEKIRIEQEELRRMEEARLRHEEQIRKEKEELDNRIQEMLQQAENYYSQGNFDLALIETAKALVNDPNHPDALALKQRIKEAQQPTQPVTELESELKEIETEKEVEEPEIELAPQEREPVFEKRPRQKISKKSFIILAVAVIIFAITIILFKYVPIILKPAPTIAILPFTSSSGILEDDILGSALAKDINMRLSYVKDFKLIGHSSVMALKNISADINKSINRAGFNYILSGTITKTGESRLINLRLTDSLNSVIFEKNLVRDPNTLNELSSEICKELTIQFGVKVEHDLTFRSPTFDQTAYLMYLRGLELLNRKSLASYNNAQQLFDQASSTDNGFADAFAASGFVSVSKIENYWDASESEFRKADDMLQRALIISPKLFTAKRSLGLLYTYQGNFKNAYKELNEAITLSPNCADNYLAAAKLYNRTGKYTDARDALSKSLTLDPYNLELLEMFAYTYQLLGDYPEAYNIYQKAYPLISDTSSFILKTVSNAILFDSDLKTNLTQNLIGMLENSINVNSNSYIDMYNLARTYQAIGKNSEAAPVLEKALRVLETKIAKDPQNSDLSIYSALVNTRMGRFPIAIEYAKKSLSQNPQSVGVKYKVARMYAIQKADSTAIDFLKKSVSIHFDLSEILDIDFFNLRTKPEFMNTLKLKDK